MRFTYQFMDLNGPSSKESELEFTRKDDVERLRKDAASLFGVEDPSQLRLLWNGKQLEDGMTLYEYQGLSKGAISSVVQVLRRRNNLDLNANVTKTPSPSVSPKSISPPSSSSSSVNSVDQYTDATSLYYNVNEKVDVLCPQGGSWFEATIKRITLKSDQQTSNNSPDDGGSNDIGDNLLYHCVYDYCGNTADLVTLDHLAPRAWKKIPFAEVAVGQKVLVNFNIEEHGLLGDWFRAEVVSKSEGRRKESLCVNLFIGFRETLEKVRITKIDEIYAFTETGLLENRKSEILPNDYEKRTTRSCIWCHDDPKRQPKCTHCRCVLCKSPENEDKMILCDECEEAYHIYCLIPKLPEVPEDDWYCAKCKTDVSAVVKAGEKIKTTKRQSKLPGIKNDCKRDWDNGMACQGTSKTCTIVPKSHFGPIPGVKVGTTWKFRVQVAEEGVHRMSVGGIHGNNDGKNGGAYSIVVSGGYSTDKDNGDDIIYTGSGGRDLSNNKRTAKQSKDQEFKQFNLALAKNCHCPLKATGGDAMDNWKKGKPVRVVRKYIKNKKEVNIYAPKEGYRYDGIYKVVKYYPTVAKHGHNVYLYHLRRDDPVPAPWTKAGRKLIEKHGLDKVIMPKHNENKAKRSAEDSNDSATDESPSAKKRKYKIDDAIVKIIRKDKHNAKQWQEILQTDYTSHIEFTDDVKLKFKCVICMDMLINPVVLPCNHFICKVCLERSFKSRQVYNCSICRYELGESFEVKIDQPLINALDAILKN